MKSSASRPSNPYRIPRIESNRLDARPASMTPARDALMTEVAPPDWPTSKAPLLIGRIRSIDWGSDEMRAWRFQQPDRIESALLHPLVPILWQIENSLDLRGIEPQQCGHALLRS